MKLVYCALFCLLSVAVAQQPATDSALGAREYNGNVEVTTFTLPPNFVRVPASEALEKVELTTTTVQTRKRKTYVVKPSGDVQTSNTTIRRVQNVALPGRYEWRVKHVGGYMQHPLTGEFYRPKTDAEIDADAVKALEALKPANGRISKP
jgi:hypothetical protein